uniref:Tropomodulin n=1 Tax=Aceria tosichella TaxID=561515 RepID=A0A6G1SBD7_9ACAR
MGDSDDYDEYEIEYTKVSKVISEKPTSKTIITSKDNNRDEQGGDNNRRKSSITQPAGIYMLYGRDLSEYDSIPVDEILAKLSPQELEQLSNEVDPDDTLLPPSQRCKDQTSKDPTGPLNRRQLIQYLTKYAIEQEDWPENKRFEPGVKKGRVFVPKVAKSDSKDEIPIMLDLDDDSSKALNSATESDLVDLAGILGLHSMLNQDQYYASITNKSQRLGDKFESVVKSTPLKPSKIEPDNTTDPIQTTDQLARNEPALEEVNLNNIKHITRDTFKKLFDSLKTNTHLKSLSLCNVGLTDGPASKLVEALRENKTLRTINLESNFLSGSMIRNLIEALLEQQAVLEFRACNQRPQILGNRIEMDITKLVEKNNTLLRLGLNFDVPDARMRVAKHLQDNNDNIRLTRIGGNQADKT